MSAADMDTPMEIDPAVEGDDPELIAAKIINEEYKVWKKNAHFIYDVFYSRALDWPTLTAQWFPDRKELPDQNLVAHRILLGTHTTNVDIPNYLQIADFQLPLSLKADPADYNAETEEIGGHGVTKKNAPSAKFHIAQKIPHQGEVNKARYMPQNPDLIATMTNSGKACIFDRTKHPSVPTSDTVNPQIELIGHKSEGFGLSWNTIKEGEIATASMDNTVKLWDIKGYSQESKTLKATRTYTHHSSVVNDLEFHPALNWMLATVSDDLTLQIIDTRKDGNSKAAKSVNQAHSDAINAVSFNPTAEYILATGSADKSVALWDLRMLKVKLHALEGHRDAVSSIEWNPINRQVLGSSSQDRRVIFWDLSAVGKEQTPEDAEDGPPELMFMHGGHTNRISDFSFNRHDPYLMCSAAEDNLIHVWRPNDALLNGADDEDVALEELEA